MSQLTDIFSEKCPKCGVGHVFAKKGNSLLLKIPKMNENCSHCGHKFEREPGYFFGSMYVSYALTIAEMVAVFFITRFIFGMSYINIIITIAIVSFVLGAFNFRLSRMLWIYMFDSRQEQAKM